MTTNLTVPQNQSELLQFIKDNLSANNRLSIRGVARLADCQDTDIIRGAAFKSEKLAQKLTPLGFEAAALSKSGFDSKATFLVLEYFAYESKSPKAQARQLLATFGALGIELTFQQLQESQTHKLPQTYKEALLALVQEVEAREQAEQALAEAQPKASKWQAYADSNGLVDIATLAQLRGTGRNRMFDLLRQMRVIKQASTLPYQQYIDNGYLVVKVVQNGKFSTEKSFLTHRGLDWLMTQLDNKTLVKA